MKYYGHLGEVPEPKLVPDEKPMPTCPCCGEDCEDVYVDFLGHVVGCDVCLTRKNAYEELLDL